MDITVIVPCYNSEKTISNCVESLLAQTKPVQIILVNDGSRDDTLRILNQYAENYANISVVSHENVGLPQTRKSGLELTKSKWVAFLDADDWVEPTMYETLLQLAENTQAQIAVCSLFNDRVAKTSISPQNVEEGAVISGVEAIRHLHLRDGVYPFMCNKLFLASFLKETVRFPEGNFIGEDYTSVLPVLRAATAVAVTKKPFYHYILHENSMSKTGFSHSHEIAFNNYTRLYNQFCNDVSICGQEDEMAQYICLEFAAIYVSMIRNAHYEKEMTEKIRCFIQKHLKSVLRGKSALYLKASMWMIARCPWLFRFGYKLIGAFSK